ncbi:MAG: VWA domain-containing protein, partial [Acidobacteria bacterium]|nr:VWA domain-containing protein [Acidobacteriota bacterium]
FESVREDGQGFPFPFNSVVALWGEEPPSPPGTLSFDLRLALEPAPLAADTALVLDFSGSMAAAACPGDHCRPKHQVLKEAVEILVRLQQALGRTDDRLGLVYFRSDVTGGRALWSVAGAEELLEAMRGESPSGSTAMGAGLYRALHLLTNSPGGGGKGVILFTDGIQNVNPRVLQDEGGLRIDDEGLGGPSTTVEGSLPLWLSPELGVRIRTVGVGATGDQASLLRAISEASHGGEGFMLTTFDPDEDLRRFFVEALVDTLREESPQLLGYRSGQLAGGAAMESFQVNRSARRLVLEVSWNPELTSPLGVVVEKDGQVVIPTRGSGDAAEDPFYSIFSFEDPSPGEWVVLISGPEGAAYEAAALADQEGLDLDLSLGRGSPRAGEPLKPKVRIEVEGQPLTGARVRARVWRPEVSVATALSEAPTPDLSGVISEPATSAGQKKLQALLQEASFWEEIQPVGGSWLPLEDQGDGSYVGVVRDTSVAGVYRVEIEVDGRHPTLGDFHREETRSVLVTVGLLWPEGSEMEVLWPATSELQIAQLILRPRDVHGNLLGPDHGDRIRVWTPGGLAAPAEDLLDGRYRVLLDGTTPDTSVRLEVMGEVLFQGELKELGDERGWNLGLSLGPTEPIHGFGPGVDGSLAA